MMKPCVAPLVLDQYEHQRPYVRTEKTGERVIVDPERTMQRILLIFYACINVGAFFAIGTTYAEKYVGFWCAFLLPGIVYFLLPVILLSVYRKLIIKKPRGSELTNFMKIIFTACKHNKFRFWRADFWGIGQAVVPGRQGRDRAVDGPCRRGRQPHHRRLHRLPLLPHLQPQRRRHRRHHVQPGRLP